MLGRLVGPLGRIFVLATLVFLYWPAFHYGLFLVVFAPVLAPHYALRTRGRRGLCLALALLAAVLAPFLGWWLGLLLWPWVWGSPEG